MSRRILILGGTGWLGGALTRAALARGADVTCLARGESGPVPSGARWIRADRTAPTAYSGATGTWDQVVELAYEPELVEPALAALASRAGHWTLVSTVSVYARDDEPGADESAALVSSGDRTDYAGAKVAAERASAGALSDRLLLARPGLIVGPGDPSDRFGYWPARFARGGTVLAPMVVGRNVQVIDVEDLATWIVHAGAEGHTGPVNAVGPPQEMGEFFRLAAVTAGFDGELRQAEDEALREQGISYWAGPHSLPLWLPASARGFAQRDDAAFRASGGVTRPLARTTAAVLADETARGIGRPRRSGLTPAQEARALERIFSGTD